MRPSARRTGVARRRWAWGLGALALALSPGLVWLAAPHDPSRGRPAAAPAIAASPRPGPLPDPLPEPGAMPKPRAAPPADGASSDGAPPVAIEPDSTREEPPGALPCPRDAAAGVYHRCLYELIRTGEQALEVELAHALRVIDRRTDLAATQRARWKNLLDEAQSRFLLYRNFDCQSVAPFEGRRGIGNFEGRALCLIAANTRRAEELRARYGLPADTIASSPPDGPQDQISVWVHAGLPPLD